MNRVIFTKILPATDTKPARVKATDGAGFSSLIFTEGMSENAGLGSLYSEESHRFAAQTLAIREGWAGQLVGGPGETGFVWVLDRNNAAPELLAALKFCAAALEAEAGKLYAAHLEQARAAIAKAGQ